MRRIGCILCILCILLTLAVSGVRMLVAQAAPAADAPDRVVLRDGTANVLDVRPDGSDLIVDLEVFGSQPVTIATGFPPCAVEATGDISVDGYRPNPALGTVIVEVSASDIQGGFGSLRIRRT